MSKSSTRSRGGNQTNDADRGEATKPAATILEQEIRVGEEQLDRSASGLLLSGLSAGLDIGVGPMLVVAVMAATEDTGVGVRLLSAFAYSLGFLIVILGRSELFTENTTLAILPLLSRQTTLAKVARLWGLVYAGNLAGVITFALVASWLGVALGLFDAGDLRELSSHLVDYDAGVIFVSAIGAGWIMGLVSWLVTAARETTAQILIIVIVTGTIAFLGLHHSIAGSIEVLFGVFGADLAAGEWVRFLVISTMGNAIGGTVLVALLKFGHITQGPAVHPRARRGG
jgi:formate/nitrite transporter FocA (FNT family)